MRILFVADGSMTPFTTYLDSLAPALARRGHEVHVLRFGDRVEPCDEVDGTYTVHHRRSPRVRGATRLRSVPGVGRFVPGPQASERWASPLRRVLLALGNARELHRLGVDVDVVEAPEHQAEGLVFALRGSPPLVVQVHGPVGVVSRYWGVGGGWRLRVSDALERLTARHAAVTVVPSRLAAAELAAAGWHAARRAETVPHAIDAESWRDVPPCTGTGPLVLAVGEVGALKGSDLLLRALASLDPALGAEVVFVGPSATRANGTPAVDDLASLARAMEVRARFVGMVDRSELGRWYAKARVVAVPSRFETFSQVALEASASGRPVVISPRAGASEVASSSGGAIVVVDPEDTRAFADALTRFLADPALAASAGERGRKFAREGLEAFVTAHEQIYAKAIRRGVSRERARASRRGR